MPFNSSQDLIIRNPYSNKDLKEYINDGGTDRLCSRLIGTVGAPSYPRQSFVEGYSSSTQNIPYQTWTQVTLGTQYLDNLGEYASSAYTPKTPGKYFCIGKVLWETVTAGKYYYLTLAKNGSRWIAYYWLEAATTSSNYFTETCCGFIDMNGTTDYITMQAYNNKGIGLTEGIFGGYSRIIGIKIA